MGYKIFFLFLILIVIPDICISGEIQAILEARGSEKADLRAGDIFEGVLKVWPFSTYHLEEFKKLEGTRIINGFYISEVQNVRYSKNNQEVLEIYGTFSILSTKLSNNYVWKYENKLIPVTIKNINLIHTRTDTWKFKVYDQGEINYQSVYTRWAVLLIGVMLIVLGMYIYQRKKKIKKTQEEWAKFNERKNQWIRYFIEAQSREDYETIFKTRKIWQSYFELEDENMEEFFTILNQCQYKKDWSDNDNDAVRSAFNNVRETYRTK
ncbi:MAG: hypothetical protein KAQ98_02030 [Bacteriovoracaceae bacterium]|nr:hypothetical protein [Bacteriovoracaceae bacterium]